MNEKLCEHSRVCNLMSNNNFYKDICAVESNGGVISIFFFSFSGELFALFAASADGIIFFFCFLLSAKLTLFMRNQLGLCECEPSKA